jgi:hypothetical protein
MDDQYPQTSNRRDLIQDEDHGDLRMRNQYNQRRAGDIEENKYTDARGGD